MTVNEVNAIYESIADNEKVSWEKTRWLGFITALTQGAKLKTPMDLIKFNWEISEEDSIELKDTRTAEEVKNNLLEIMNRL